MVKIINPCADFEQDRFPIAASLDGNPGTAWSIDPRVGINHTAVFEIGSSQQSGFEGGTKLTFTLDFQIFMSTPWAVSACRSAATRPLSTGSRHASPH